MPFPPRRVRCRAVTPALLALPPGFAANWDASTTHLCPTTHYRVVRTHTASPPPPPPAPHPTFWTPTFISRYLRAFATDARRARTGRGLVRFGCLLHVACCTGTFTLYDSSTLQFGRSVHERALHATFTVLGYCVRLYSTFLQSHVRDILRRGCCILPPYRHTLCMVILPSVPACHSAHTPTVPRDPTTALPTLRGLLVLLYHDCCAALRYRTGSGHWTPATPGSRTYP